MFEKIKSVLSVQTEQQNKIGKADLDERVRIATAVILLEVAHSDEEFSQEEHAHILDILKRDFNLDHESVNELIQISEEERKGSIDIWHFTSTINENYSDEEKYVIIEKIWQVIYADGRLDKYEDYMVHKLSNLLHIPHNRMIQAKLKYLPES
jgi:uncharacterized tellurite resistance protein B-like protein